MCTGKAEGGADVDDELLDGVHVGARVVGHGEDGVPDQLTRSVPGDVAAPIGDDELGSELVLRHPEVLESAAQADGVHGMVLEEQQVRVGGAVEQPPLEGVGVGEADAAQPAGLERHSSWDQSRVSRISRHRARNAEA